MGAGAHVKNEAIRTVQDYNLASVGHMLEIYYADYAKYPGNLADLVNEGEIRNLKVESYVYRVAEDFQSAELCLLENNNCWNSF